MQIGLVEECGLYVPKVSIREQLDIRIFFLIGVLIEILSQIDRSSLAADIIAVNGTELKCQSISQTP